MATVWGKVSGRLSGQVAVLVWHYSRRLGFCIHFKLGVQNHLWPYRSYWLYKLHHWADYWMGRIFDDCLEMDINARGVQHSAQHGYYILKDKAPHRTKQNNAKIYDLSF